jgi:hypothetical protein
LPDGPVRIRIVDTEASAQQMTRQLRDQGLDITIKTIPGSTQVVGRWVVWGGDGGDSASDDAAMAQQMADQPPVVEIPKGLLGRHLFLEVGRQARPGEAWQVGGIHNALRPGGSLFCLRLVGTSPSDAAAILTEKGYRVHFDTKISGWRLTTTEPPAGRVATAYVWDEVMGIAGTTKDVYLTVMDPSAPKYAATTWFEWPKTVQDGGVRDYSSCPSS